MLVLGRVALVAIAACATPGFIVPTSPGLRRTVTLRDEARDARDGVASGGVRCGRIVLDEQVTLTDHDRELEIDAQIVDGDAPVCGVGRHLAIRMPRGYEQGTQVIADEPLARETAELIARLHAQLGRVGGPFALCADELPWRATPVRRGELIELRVDRRSHDDNGWSYGDIDSGTRVRVRVHDRRLSCATAYANSRGGGEHGAFNSAWRQQLAIDYHDGRGACSE